MNPLFQQMNNNTQNPIIQRFQQFKQQFRGNPQEQVQQLLNSGKITQAQYDQAVRTANSLMQMIGGK